jgi:arginase
MHGMPVGFLLSDVMERTAKVNGNSPTIPGFEWLRDEFTNRLSPHQFVYIGLRDVDIEERKIISSFGIQAYTMTEIDRTLFGIIGWLCFVKRVDCTSFSIVVVAVVVVVVVWCFLFILHTGYGIGAVIDMALRHLGDRPLHLSYDIDAVDPVLAPATGTAVRGGLTFREAHYVAEAVAASGRLSSAEIVELNPMLSNETGAHDTIDLGLQIILSLMGKSII